MIKSVLKEICIMILLCVAIVVVLGVLFYDYFPQNSSKIIPNRVSYSVPEDIKEELKLSLSGNTQQVIKTYTVEDTDLSVYEKTNYDKGKKNPFAPDKDENVSNNTNENKNTTNNNTSNTNSTGSFFENTGTK